MSPIRPNALWALDFQFDVTVDGRTLKMLNIVDEFTRECPAIVVERNIDADLVVATLERLVLERGAPAFVRFDNGPEFHCLRRGRLVPLQRHQLDLHRPRFTLAERLDRILQRAGYATSCSTAGSSTAVGGQGPHRGLAHRLQHQPPTQCPRRAHPERVRQAWTYRHEQIPA